MTVRPLASFHWVNWISGAVTTGGSDRCAARGVATDCAGAPAGNPKRLMLSTSKAEIERTDTVTVMMRILSGFFAAVSRAARVFSYTPAGTSITCAECG